MSVRSIEHLGWIRSSVPFKQSAVTCETSLNSLHVFKQQRDIIAMYWPIGAPKAYALSKHAISRTKVIHSEDGIQDGAESAEPSSISAGTVSSTESLDDGSQSAEAVSVKDAETQNGISLGKREDILRG